MKKHNKNATSFAGGPSMKSVKAGEKKKETQEKSHTSQKSNLNLDKKAHTQVGKTIHKPAETQKKPVSKGEEKEKETPPSKNEKVEKPQLKTETTKEKLQKPQTQVKEPRPSSSNIQNAFDSKKANDEKRNLLREIENLKRENTTLKNKVQEMDNTNVDLLNEMEKNQESSVKFIKERNEMEVICKKAQQELKLISQRYDELTKKMEELQDDIEIYKEESETKELEMQVLQKQFDEYKVKAEAEIKKAKSNIGKPQSEEKSSEEQNQPQTEQSANNSTVDTAKISELEEIINDLSNQLSSTAEERDYAIKYYKDEIEKQNKKIEEYKNKAEIIPQKDELIRQLTEKLKEDEGIVEALQNQIAVLSPANEMYEELIIEKEDLEKTMEEIRNENVQLKESVKENEDLANEYKEIADLSEDFMKKKESENLEMKKNVEEMEKKVKEYEENQTMLLNKIEDLKNKNKLLKEDTTLLQGNSLNMKNILIENETNKNIIQNLKRQKIAYDIFAIDNEKFLLRNKIVKNMIPKKLLETGNMVVFDKFLNINSYRKTTFKLILNQLNNEILTDDLGKNPNKTEEDKMGKIEGEEKKKIISFYELTINTLAEFYSYILKMEIYLSELSSEEFLKVNNENSFNDVYNTIVGGYSIFNGIINLVKSNNFTIFHKSNVDGLKNINTQLKKEIGELHNIEENSLYTYFINVLNYFIRICCGFKKERIDIIVEDPEVDEKLKNVADSFFDSNKNLNNIISKIEETFFENMRYPLSNTIFDTENSFFQELSKKNNQIEQELSEKKDFKEKYTSLINVFNNVYSIMKEAIEKMEPSKADENKKTYQDDRIILPIPEWNNITDVLYTDLENITKVTEELEKSRKTVEEEKKKYTELTMKYENLEKMKKENDSKLGELTVKLGKFTQLETANEENTIKIEKYQKVFLTLNNQVMDLENKEKEYKAKIEVLEKKEKEKKHLKKTMGVDLEKLKLSNGAGDEGVSFNGGELLKTVFSLEKEQKKYKNKFMKEKLNKLMEDKDSYMNKYIQKDYKSSKKEIEKEKAMYQNIQDKVIDLNKKYIRLRRKLCLPEVYDLSNKDYDYEKFKKKQEDEIENKRIEYMIDVDGIFFDMFGENSNSKTMKEIVNSDVNKNLEKFADKKYLVGKIQFNEGKKDENKDGSATISSKNTLGVPIIINEDYLTKINQNLLG